jgi:uncharacterized small protein (DUF1192 family)
MTAQESALRLQLSLMAETCRRESANLEYYGTPVNLEEVESRMAVLQAEIKGYREEQQNERTR